MSFSRFWLGLVVAFFWPASVCLAGLGGAPLAGDSVQYRATAGGVTYRLHTTTQPNGVLLREYVTAGGVVFALGWSGPFMPDLRELLGSRFEYLEAEAAKVPMAGRSQLVVQRPELMLFSGGHMRAFTGRAWVPSLLPAGFDPAGIH